MRAPWAFLAAALAGAFCGACQVPVTPRPPAGLSLQIQTRQSCGIFSGLDYDTSCLSSVFVLVRDYPSRAILLEECATLSERKVQLGEILRGDPLLAFAGLSAHRTVTFEVRGLHDKPPAPDAGVLDAGVLDAGVIDAGVLDAGVIDAGVIDAGTDAGVEPTVILDRCAAADIVDNWLFWGESDPVDLAALDADGGSILVPVVVDCRDCAFECEGGDCYGCQGLGVRSCPSRFPTSFCVPAVDFRCDKRCTDDDDCFEGTLQCDLDAGVCDDSARTGGLCARCGRLDGVPDGGVEGCAEGYSCVGRPGATQGVCAPSCPDSFCRAGTKCNRVGNNLIIVGG